MRRVLNLRLLVVSLAIGGVVCLAGYGWYRYRRSQVATVFEMRAAALEKEGAWSDAVGYLERYLQLKPDDIDAHVRLVAAMEHSAQSVHQRRNLIGLLYQTLGLSPERHDLRLKLASQLFDAGDSSAAEIEANKISDKSSNADEKDKRAARKLIALAHYGRAAPVVPVASKQQRKI